MNKYNYNNISQSSQLYDLLLIYDDYFEPVLSNQVASLKNYSEKLFKYANNITISFDNEVVGLVSFYNNDKQKLVAFISLIVVNKKFNKCGLGTKLLDICEEHCKVVGMNSIILSVNINNTNAIKFYEKNNFVVLNRKKADFIDMIKKLNV